ncbi:hypothetical protein COHA_001009 [Chlorella ohadii]|uniref:Calcineurin-like phosphoesterase domain-containing protein n=1 Tax=Chlorella ohadii TaxID=2649997 RepID=A0AAD5E2H0_9CHLO|nr:hypothetical protein COHA_001009 [Chlorella ohadii]
MLHKSGCSSGMCATQHLCETTATHPSPRLQGGETGELDNASITRTQQRLYRAVAAINAVRPPPQLAVFGGDVVHNGLEHLAQLGLNASGLRRLLAEPVNGYKIASALLGQLQMPRLYVWGNHDNLVTCGDEQASPSKALVAQVYQRFFSAKPYASRNVGRHWKIVVLNSMYGDTWDAASPQCQSLLSSYGEEQLRWLDAQLSEGRHTLLTTHHPLSTAILNEVNTSQRWSDLRSVVEAHPNVRLVLTGHFHKGLDWGSTFPFPTRTLPAVRYSAQNFFILDLHPDGSFSWSDWDKNRGGGRCNDWWTYNGGAGQRQGAVEGNDPGDCGQPAAGEEGSWPLDPMHNRSSLPSIDAFNPERSCLFVLWQPFLEACASGASADCCEVMQVATRLSSSAPFSSCLCASEFWQASVEYMQREHGLDLGQLLRQCINEYDSLLAFRGGPLTYCGSAPAGAQTAAL